MTPWSGKRLCFLLLTVVLLTVGMLLWAMPAAAIQFGTYDTGHPYVCLVQILGDNQWRGTGIQISPRVIVTAGHITYGFDHADIFFSPTVSDLSKPDMESTQLYTMPGYSEAGGYHDVGVVILPKAHRLTHYAVLPASGLVDALPMKDDLQLVGYGANYQERGTGVFPWYTWRWLNQRYQCSSHLVQDQGVQNTFAGQALAFTANPAGGDGAIGPGDSGGPVIDVDSHTVLGLMCYSHSWNCRGVNLAQRLDFQDILDWIASYRGSLLTSRGLTGRLCGGGRSCRRRPRPPNLSPR